MLDDDQAELKDRANLQAGCVTGSRNEAHVLPARADSVDEQEPRWDARHERGDEEPSEDATSPLNIHSLPQSRRNGHIDECWLLAGRDATCP